MFLIRRQLWTNGLPKEPAGGAGKPPAAGMVQVAKALQLSRWRRSVELLLIEQSAKTPGTAVTSSGPESDALRRAPVHTLSTWLPKMLVGKSGVVICAGP